MLLHTVTQNKVIADWLCNNDVVNSGNMCYDDPGQTTWEKINQMGQTKYYG